MIRQRKSCYCAFCKTQRKVYLHKHLSILELIGLVFFGIVLTYVIFKNLDLGGLVIIGALLVIGELFVQTKWRTSMICSNCGFDPVVYVKSPEQAGLKIKAFLDKRSTSAGHLLRPPVDMRPKKSSKGQNLALKV